MVVSRERVKACVERAMVLDTSGAIDAQETACRAVAEALHLPVETVRECVQPEEVAAC